MKDFANDQLQISIMDTSPVKMIWNGSSDYREPSRLLEPYFNDFVNDLLAKELDIDFFDFKYMNSSTVTSLIYLINLLNEKKIKTKITYKKNSKWQSASFKAIETLADDMEYISVEWK